MNLPKIIVGVMKWGKWGAQLNTSEMSDLISFCIDNKLNCFDHADIYGGYTTEKEFGDAMIFGKIDRTKVQLISKCGIKLPCENNNYKIKNYDYSAKYIIQQAEQSLKNLRTDYLDVFLLHRPSPLLNPEEVALAIEQLKRDGKILSFGVSNFTNHQMALLKKHIDIQFNQIELSVSYHQPIISGTLDFHEFHHITTMAWRPLGNIFDEHKNQKLTNLLEELSHKYNCKIDTLLLAWLMQHPHKIIPVVGTVKKRKNTKSTQSTRHLFRIRGLVCYVRSNKRKKG